MGDEVPQKLKQNVKLVYNFCRFPVLFGGHHKVESVAKITIFE